MCFKYSVQCGAYKIYEKDHAGEMYHYKNINGTLNWTNGKFHLTFTSTLLKKVITDSYPSMFIFRTRTRENRATAI